MFSAIVIYVL